MNTEDKNNVSIIDKYGNLLQDLASLLYQKKYYKILYLVNSADEFVEALKDLEEKPEILLVDIHLTIGKDYEVFQNLHSNFPEIKIIGLFDEQSDSHLMLSSPNFFYGFISKSFSPQFIFEQIEKLKKRYKS